MDIFYLIFHKYDSDVNYTRILRQTVVNEVEKTNTGSGNARVNTIYH